jgi:hypothetical protein
MEDNLNFRNLRRPQFLKMEDDLTQKDYSLAKLGDGRG